MQLKTINDAIRKRKVITFNYKGNFRKVEPYQTGQYITTAKDYLSAWFLEGYSSSGEYNTWKTYSIDEIENVQILDLTFDGDRPNYNPYNEKMEVIYESI